MSRSLPASLPILFVSEVLFTLGYGLFLTLVSVRMSLEGFPAQRAGLMMSLGSAGFVAGSFVFVHLIRGVGHIRVFAASAAVVAVTTLLHSLVIDPLAWGALRTVSGFFIAGLLMVIESWIGGVSTNATRGRILALYVVLSTVSLAGGQWLLNLADPGGYELFSVAAILFALAVVPLSLYRFRIEQTDSGAFSPLSLRALYRLVPTGVVGAVVAGMMVHAFFALAPFYTTELGFSTGETARYMTLTTLIAMFTQWVIGRASDRFDRRRVIGSIAIAMALSGVAVALASGGGNGFVLLVVLTCVLTAFMHTLYSLCIAHANDHIRTDEIIPVASALLMAYGLGSIIGPYLASVCMDGLGPAGLFAFLAFSGATLWGFVLVGPRGRARLETAAGQNDYVHVMPAADATPMLSELEPAAEAPTNPDKPPESEQRGG